MIKFDENTMCSKCFGKMLSKLPFRLLMDGKHIEKQRQRGCNCKKSEGSH